MIVVEPGIDPDGRGYTEVSWNMYETVPDGVETVVDQLDPTWDLQIHWYCFASDMQDYAGLHGLVVYERINMPESKHPKQAVRFGREEIAGDFVVCGLIDSQPVPLHNQAQAEEVIEWLLVKQRQWYVQYGDEGKDRDAAAEVGQAASLNPGSGASQRRERKTVH